MSLLNQINGTLLKIDKNVYYGMQTHDEEETWDYIIFSRKKLKPSSKGLTSYTYYYSITIVRENYIEEDFEQKVINEIEKETNLKLADNEYMFNYMMKPNSNIVIELLTIDFIKSKKKDV